MANRERSADTLIVTADTDFATLMRVAEGMSYNHDQFDVCARGRNVQRGFEIVNMLISRDRTRQEDVEHKYDSIEYNGRKVLQMQWTVTSIKTEEEEDDDDD